MEEQEICVKVEGYADVKKRCLTVEMKQRLVRGKLWKAKQGRGCACQSRVESTGRFMFDDPLCKKRIVSSLTRSRRIDARQERFMTAMVWYQQFEKSKSMLFF